VRNNYAYIAAEQTGLQVIDISEPTQPRVVAACDTPGIAGAVKLHENRAYIGDGQGGLQIIDITNPLQPARLGGRTFGTYVGGSEVIGSRAYVADGVGLSIIDVSNPADLQLIGSIAFDPTRTSGQPIDVAVAGNYAYVADWASGLQVVDISDPARPRVVGGNELLFGFKAKIANAKVFVAGSNRPVAILDLFQPQTPEVHLDQLITRIPGSLRMLLRGPAGLSGQIQRMTDFGAWQNWKPVQLDSAPALEITDATSASASFYKFVSP
jgi:hypothetical protein